ncbi:MAG: hypothetical protein LDL19_05850 [Thiobacillus sp.]|nr:hypothetical protein [Thiobacillus sp.]
MRPTPTARLHKAYVIWLGLVWAGLCLGVLAINSVVDPLWYFQGNLITQHNGGFNERESKLNLFLQDPDQYDCLIFGSSRATGLPASALKPLKCFNLSFASGQPKEFIAYAKYLRARGFRPEYIVIGVDGFIFQTEGRDPVTIPSHVMENRDPPSPLKAYLSIGSLNMTWNELVKMEQSNNREYYDSRFEKVPGKNMPVFNPMKTLEVVGLRRADAEARRKSPFSSHSARLYQELARVFPGSKTLAYVPPVSAWHVAEMQQNGVLDGYLDALYTTANLFPVFLDFSIPSPITWNPTNTYDGSHFYPWVNRSIAKALIAREPMGWGITPATMSLDAYRARYLAALEQFRQSTATGQSNRNSDSH